MANVNVKLKLEKIERDLEAVVKHISMYSGIPKEHAGRIGRTADSIKSMAEAISHDSNETLLGGGHRRRG